MLFVMTFVRRRIKGLPTYLLCCCTISCRRRLRRMAAPILRSLCHDCVGVYVCRWMSGCVGWVCTTLARLNENFWSEWLETWHDTESKPDFGFKTSRVMELLRFLHVHVNILKFLVTAVT